MTTGPYKTSSNLLEAAAAVERAAGKRYLELAEEMKNTGNIKLEVIFRDLAAEEGAHLQTLQEWSGSEEVGERSEGDWRQVGPEVGTGDEEPPDPYTLTAYRALSIAVHNEERAFAFFSAVAADADDPEVRDLAERLAHEELGHAAKLRQARRAAYRAAGRRPDFRRWVLPQAEIEEFRHFRTAAASLESAIALRHEALAARLADSAASGADSVAAVAQQSREAATALETAGWTGESARREVDAELPAATPAALRDMLLDLEEAYAFYAGIADAGPDEATVTEAQRLAHEAIRRLAGIREALSQGRSPPWH